MGTPVISDLIGCRYSETGDSREDGYSCLGLALEIYRRAGIAFPDPRYEEVELQPVDGDWPPFALVAYGSASWITHCAVYLGYGLVIHSAQGVGVEVVPVTKPGVIRRVYHYDSRA